MGWLVDIFLRLKEWYRYYRFKEKIFKEDTPALIERLKNIKQGEGRKVHLIFVVLHARRYGVDGLMEIFVDRENEFSEEVRSRAATIIITTVRKDSGVRYFSVPDNFLDPEHGRVSYLISIVMHDNCFLEVVLDVTDSLTEPEREKIFEFFSDFTKILEIRRDQLQVLRQSLSKQGGSKTTKNP